jgi:hypothetical protein
MLGKIISSGQREWDEMLPIVMAAYRALPRSSTGYSPNYLFLGRELRMPLDLVMGSPADEQVGDGTFNDIIMKMRADPEVAYAAAR